MTKNQMLPNLIMIWTSKSLLLTVTVVICQQIGASGTLVNISTGDDDGKLNSTGLATKYGHPPKQYEVVTEDGYILTLFRLPGKGSIPVMLVHGFVDTSDSFLIRGYTSPAIYLADMGYDVWLVNTRGNKYSRRHKHLDPDTDAAFWQFSFHEKGCYDLPAVIDTILNETGAKNLTAIGHSEGNTIFYVLGSEKKEYNAKINVLIALAPIAFLHNTLPPISTIIQLEPIISVLVKTLGIHELLGNKTIPGVLIHTICAVPIIGYTLCAYGAVFPLVGSDPGELEQDFFQNVAPHYPDGESAQSFLHFLQVGYKKEFAQYDYGTETNLKVYNTSEPPLYQLDEVTMPIALYAAANDLLSSIADVAILMGKLPNVVYYLLNPWGLCNHIDYLYGRNVGNYLYPYINIVLDRYNPL